MKIKNIFKSIEKTFKYKATSFIKSELEDYESVFSFLLIGLFSGVPSPPAGLIIRLLPYMEKEITVMIEKSTLLDDSFATILSKFDID